MKWFGRSGKGSKGSGAEDIGDISNRASISEVSPEKEAKSLEGHTPILPEDRPVGGSEDPYEGVEYVMVGRRVKKGEDGQVSRGNDGKPIVTGYRIIPLTGQEDYMGKAFDLSPREFGQVCEGLDGVPWREDPKLKETSLYERLTDSNVARYSPLELQLTLADRRESRGKQK